MISRIFRLASLWSHTHDAHNERITENDFPSAADACLCVVRCVQIWASLLCIITDPQYHPSGTRADDTYHWSATRASCTDGWTIGWLRRPPRCRRRTGACEAMQLCECAPTCEESIRLLWSRVSHCRPAASASAFVSASAVCCSVRDLVKAHMAFTIIFCFARFAHSIVYKLALATPIRTACWLIGVLSMFALGIVGCVAAFRIQHAD